MGELKPSSLLLIGPPALGVAVSAVCLTTLPDDRSLSMVGLGFAIGIVGGLVFLGPIAAAMAWRRQLRWWAARFEPALKGVVGLLGLLSLGCIIASARHDTSDWITGVAMLIVGSSAMLNVLLDVVLAVQPGRAAPGGGGRNDRPPPPKPPRPPFAPVPAPRGGPLPELAAAKEIASRANVRSEAVAESTPATPPECG